MPTFPSQGLNLAYYDERPEMAGEGPPVLLIHGFASSFRTNWAGTGWTSTLRHGGRRVVALDNRGHGGSDKPHDPAAYATALMARDAHNLLDHLDIPEADVIGYSMGARIAAQLALLSPTRVRRLVLGGLGIRLVEGALLPAGIAEAMEAPELADLTDPTQRLFRTFADAGGNDLAALAACIRGSRQSLSAEDVSRIRQPALVAIGTKDEVSGAGAPLAALLPRGVALDIPGKDHNLAVGDKAFKAATLAFLSA